MLKIARSTCYDCHEIRPRTEMVRVGIREKSGDSIGVSGNPSGKNSTRVSTRTYYRNRTVWKCIPCAERGAGAKKLWWFIVFCAVAALGYVYL